jgi:hypothetical protein
LTLALGDRSLRCSRPAAGLVRASDPLGLRETLAFGNSRSRADARRKARATRPPPLTASIRVRSGRVLVCADRNRMAERLRLPPDLAVPTEPPARLDVCIRDPAGLAGALACDERGPRRGDPDACSARNPRLAGSCCPAGETASVRDRRAHPRRLRTRVFLSLVAGLNAARTARSSVDP